MFRFALSCFTSCFSLACLKLHAFSALPPSWYYIYLYFCVLTLRAGVHSAVLSENENVSPADTCTLWGWSDAFLWITPYGGDLTFLINAAVVRSKVFKVACKHVGDQSYVWAPADC